MGPIPIMGTNYMNKCILFNISTRSDDLLRGPGMYRIAHWLREHEWDVESIEYANYWTADELKALARSRIDANTKFLGFSHMFSIWSDTLEEFCLWMKLTYPDVVLISGSSVRPSFTSKAIDYYVQGFGEQAILVVLKYLFSNGTRPKINIFNNGLKKIIAANDHYPAYPMKSLMIKYEDRDFVESWEPLGIEFARGCMFACDFCNFPVLGVKGDYTRDADDFVLQVRDAYDRFGVTNYLVADETFNDRTDKITKFADAVEQLDFQPWFSGFIRADLLISRPKEREELLRMNFLGQYYGIESLNTKTAKSVGKGMDCERVKQGLVEIKNYFKTHGRKQYRGTISLMVGLPHETMETMQTTKQWLIDHWQGENFVVFATEIGISDMDKKSKMSADYEKYGYTIMTAEQIEEAKTRSKYPAVFIHMNHGLLMWENQHMNYFDAVAIADDFYKMLYNNQYDFTIDCWAMFHPGIIGGLNSKLARKRGTWMEAEGVGNNIIKNYITKKLNWLP